jgi:hypothetical protein
VNCRLCGTKEQLIKAHIIPRPFFTARSGRQSQKFLTNTPGVFPKRAPAGFYDTGILCAQCDRRLGVWDQYAVELFLHQFSAFVPFPDGGPTIAFTRADFDYERLRLFFLSLLWRAGVSSHPNFARVRLGPYEHPLREMVRAGDAGDPDDFCTVLSAFTLRGKFRKTGIPILDPHRERWNGVNAYRISLGVVTAYVKVDKAAFPESFVRMAIKPGEPLYLLERDFADSPELRAAQSIARAPQNRNAFGKGRSASSEHDV